MGTANENNFVPDSPAEASSLDSTLNVLLYKLQNLPKFVAEILPECNQIKKYLSSSKEQVDQVKVRKIISCIDINSDNIKTEIFSLLAELIPKLTEPWIIIEELLSVKDEQSIFRGLNLLELLVEKKQIDVGSEMISYFAEEQEIENSVLSTTQALEKIASIINSVADKFNKSYTDIIFEMYLGKKGKKFRILGAKLLDLNDTTADEKTIEKLFDKQSAEILSPYLSYTRSTHFDLLYLTPVIGKPAPILDSLKECEKICGEYILQEVISKIGWKNLNFGLSVQHYVGITIGESLPLFVTNCEARLFQNSVNAKRVSEFYLFTAQGGLPLETGTSGEDSKPVSLFRSYNLAHANLLQEILDVAPLTRQKVKHILEQMDRIVNDFVKLFSSYSEECTILPEVYGQIKSKVINELSKDGSELHLSGDATRLVQMFEDPHSLGEVNTLHGLKRYLHQRALQLGFKLVDQSRSPNQSINLVLTTNSRVRSVVRNINFANFEAVEEERLSFTKIPYPISVVIEAFKRQMLHGLDKFPTVNIFCYGNEVHYFVWFRNHPVFIRIDYSPPLQGGMIDLQYFGVSNYEIADHPNIYLDAIRYLFQYLEFDVELDGTHIHARYDKERALDLNQLCGRVDYLFCLSPYLMDLDWVIGSLNLFSDSKKKVATAWAELFKQWGVLPFDKLITKDRLGIVQDILVTTEGEQELIWTGDGDYKDRFSVNVEPEFFQNLYICVNNLGLRIPKFSEANFNLPGQMYWEERLLNYLRTAVTESELVETTAGFERVSPELFSKIHEVDWFAEIINQAGKELESSIALAKVIIPFEQTLKFQTTGLLESFKVQSAILPMVGNSLKLFVLRDNKGIIRSGFFVTENSIHQKRKNINETWQTNVKLSPIELMSLLRANNYTVAGSESAIEFLEEEVKKFYDELKMPHKYTAGIRTTGEKIVAGLRASPGRAAGKVMLGSEGRHPEDFDEHIFVAASVSPDENTILYHSAGIVATGGGILSHAGLIATQFNKPAIIISGNWKQDIDGSMILVYQTTEYEVEHKIRNNLNLSLYYDLHDVKYQMQDGDLVVLDANQGILQVLGQERDTIALFEELKSLGKTNEEISKLSDVKELLILRGKKLHTRHQIEKLLRRISEPVLTRYVVEEILVGNFLDGNKSTPEEKAYLLKLILSNEKISGLAEGYILQTVNEIENKFLHSYSKAEQIIPFAKHPFEIVMPRLEAFEIFKMMKSVIAAVGSNILQEIKIPESLIDKIDEISIHRLKVIRDNIFEEIKNLVQHPEKKKFLRHLFRQIKRVDLLLDTSLEKNEHITQLEKRFEIRDKTLSEKLSNKFIIKPGEGALELSSAIGWKAANLAELEAIGGKGRVPPWFAVADKAFQTVLDTPLNESISVSGENLGKGISLREAINKIILLSDISNREKSLHIKNLWTSIVLTEEIRLEVIEAYREIEKEFLENSTKENDAKLYVAIRSSSCEEDAEIDARAGEFETYLFITGEEFLIEYLKRTWSGLWTERAIHNRSIFGHQNVPASGGVIVQRIIWSRVSGVLQTINVPKKDLREIVINAGLGLGEGVVSGAVAADQIIVSKEGNLEKGPLKFNYITADKINQYIFNKRVGYGTVISPTLYHQRFRPALEYVELCELIAMASRLESAYGYPLDIEFGIEGTKLWILQVRPVATFLPAFRETLNNYPLSQKSSKSTQENLI
jgi:pyruvate,water dikinase